MKILFWIAFLSTSCSSCTVTSYGTRSILDKTDTFDRIENEQLQYENFDFYVHLNNHFTNKKHVHFCIIPFPFEWKDENIRVRTTLGVTIGLLPRRKHIAIDLSQIYLSIDQHKNIQPSKYTIRGVDTSQFAKNWMKRGRVVCGAKLVGMTYENITSTPISFDNVDWWNCVELIFEIPPPDPKQRITMKIDGLKINSIKFDIPELYFKEENFKWYDSVP